MALHRAKTSDIPSDAIRLTRNDALDHQLKIIYEWPDWKDVFFLKHGASLLAGASAAIGVFCNNHYRTKLKLRNYGKVSSFMATAIIPAGLTLVFHHGFVLPNILLQDSCAVCTEIRAASLQAVLGCALPTVLAPLSCFSTALNYGTYNVPYITEPLKVLNLWRKLTKPIGNVLFSLFLAQALLASGMTMLQSRNVQTISIAMDNKYKEHEYSY